MPSEAGEDEIVVCQKCKYAASSQIAACKEEKTKSQEKKLPIAEVETPGVTTIEILIILFVL